MLQIASSQIIWIINSQLYLKNKIKEYTVR